MNTHIVESQRNLETFHKVRAAFAADADPVATIMNKTGRSRDDVEKSISAFMALSEKDFLALVPKTGTTEAKGGRLSLEPAETDQLRAGFLPLVLLAFDAAILTYDIYLASKL